MTDILLRLRLYLTFVYQSVHVQRQPALMPLLPSMNYLVL